MKRLAAIGLLVVVAAGVAGCGRDQPASALVGTEEIGADDRGEALALSGTLIDGESFDLKELRGRVVVLNSWASWCPPCEAEMPAFVGLAESADPADVAVVGLNVSDDEGAARAFMAEKGIDFPVVVDPDGSLLASIPGVPPKSLPSTVILDREGRIAVRIIGATDPIALAQELGTVLSGSPAVAG